jgi:hypothetical protein
MTVNRWPLVACALLGACTAPGVIGIWPDGGATAESTEAGTHATHSGPGCGLDAPAFCETFDTPAGNGSRSGQLDSTIWSVSRCTGYVNLGQGGHDAWSPTRLVRCGQSVSVQPENDVDICDGRLVEATSDDGTVTTLAMSVKQPFDIAGRTGIVTFDVSNNSQSRQWPELAYADDPSPAVFTAHDTWGGLTKNGLAISLNGDCAPDSGCGACPGTTSYRRVGFGGATVVSNYAKSVIGAAFNDSRVTLFDCVAAASSPDQLNHFEVHIGQNDIEIYGTDAGTTAPLKKLVVIHDVNLTLTRGYLSLKDVHNSGDVAGGLGTNTFAWDNFGFDGPRLPRDLAFGVNDSLIPLADGRVNLGWVVFAGAPQDITATGVSGIDKASAGWLTFTFASDQGPATIAYAVNGNPEHVVPWPYPDDQPYSWKTIALPVSLGEMVVGANVIRISTKDKPIVFANVDLVLTGAGE